MRIPQDRIFTCLAEVFDCSWSVIPSLKMRSEFCCNLMRSVCIPPLFVLSYFLMEQHLRTRGNAIMQNAPVQGMGESVATCNGPIRPFRPAICFYEVSVLAKVRIEALDTDKGGVKGRSGGCGRELHTGDTRCFKRALLFRAETLDIPLNHLPEARGDVGGYGCLFLLQTPCCSLWGQDIPRYQVICHTDEEEGIPFGPLVECSTKRPGWDTWKALSQISLYSFCCQERKRKTLTPIMELELLCE